jgi:SpoVK/Ycf46/Vps4 family AAA+-type ATPase
MFPVNVANPYFPDVDDGKGMPIVGICCQNEAVDVPDHEFPVQWSNRMIGVYPSTSPELMLHSEWKKLYTEDRKRLSDRKIDDKELDRVVMSVENRNAIVAVLKQHIHQDKIFNKWGMGKVIEYGKGMTMLFWGPPGTGKTWTATCLAKAIGRELLVMDNAMLQSSTPGEMERNVKQAFKDAKSKHKVLLFDECDSLLSSRSNVGMILGSHINTLLREIELFEGICIMTTNRIGELDEALERRLSLVLEFPAPTKDQLKVIWQKFLPDTLPLNKDVDIEEMIEWELTGGLVKNVVLNAVRFAVSDDKEEVSMSHFRRAAKLTGKSMVAFETPSRAPRTVGLVHNQ